MRIAESWVRPRRISFELSNSEATLTYTSTTPANGHVISGTFGDNTFTLSQIAITPGGIGTNPSITFTLETPFGSERVDEDIFDGDMTREEGCWIDRHTSFYLHERDGEELLAEVNSILKPLVANTKLRLEDIEASAKAAGLTITFQDGDLSDTWHLYRREDNDLISSGASLHIIQGELREYRKAARARRRKA